MKPAYKLAIKLGIPVILQPEWDKCQKLQKEGRNLQYKGKTFQKEGAKIWQEGEKLRNEGWELYRKAVTQKLGPKYTGRIDWSTGEVRSEYLPS